MSMPLDFVQLEFWTYGFMGAVFTQTLWTAPGIAFYMWFNLVYLAIHREDPSTLQFDFHTWPVISLLSGMWVGFWLAWALKLDILVDTTMKNYRNTTRYLAPEFTIMTFGSLCALLGYYYFNGDFSDGSGTVPQNIAFPVGIFLFVFGWAVAIGIIIWGLVSKKDRFNKTMNIKYSLALAIGITIAPSLYDYPHNAGLSPWHGVIALAGIIVYWVLMYLYIGWIISDENGIKFSKKGFFEGFEKHASNKDIDRFHNKRQAILFIILGGISQFLVYLVGWLVDIYTGFEPWTVVLAIEVTSLLLSVSFIAMSSQLGSHYNKNYSKKSNGSGDDDNDDDKSEAIATQKTLLHHMRNIGAHKRYNNDRGYHDDDHDWYASDIVISVCCGLVFCGIIAFLIVSVILNHQLVPSPVPTP